jgi:hypothetical protein
MTLRTNERYTSWEKGEEKRGAESEWGQAIQPKNTHLIQYPTYVRAIQIQIKGRRRF